MSRSELFSALCALALGACVVQMPRVAIEPHLELVGPAPFGTEGASELAVAPFADRRSEHRAEHPAWSFRPWRITRRGWNRTGADRFPSAAEGVRRDAIATLTHSGLFAGIVESGEGSGAELVLEGRLEEFSGRQYQHSELSLLRAGFLRHRLEAPVGVVRVHYRLRERASGRVLLSDRIETRRASPDRDISGAALDAMALTNERLVQALHSLLRPNAAAESRQVLASVLDGCGMGRQRVQRLLADANEILVREIGLRLLAEVKVWSPPADAHDETTLLEALRGQERPPGGLVLALVAMPRPPFSVFAAPRFGLASPLGEHAVVACEPGAPAPPLTVAHEVAHLFGAVHVRDRSSIMHPVAAFDARMFDEINRRILRTAVQRPLGQPLPPELARRISQLYREAAASSALFDPQDLEAALSALEGSS